jgi:hypothetical protein
VGLCFANGGRLVISALIKGINVKGVSVYVSFEIFKRQLNVYSEDNVFLSSGDTTLLFNYNFLKKKKTLQTSLTS